MKYFIGADIGTTNIKAVLFRQDGAPLCRCGSPYATYHPAQGCAEQAPEDWYSVLARVVGSLVSENGVEAGDILCLTLTGHIRSVAFLGEKLETVYPGVIWSDTRSAAVAEEMNLRWEPELLRVTGNRAATNYALPQALWLRQNRPELWKRTRFLAAPKDYVLFRLTGSFVSDPSTQAGSLLLDLEKKCWSDEILDIFGIQEGMLPRIARSIDLAGYITREAAGDTGLAEGTPVIVGGGDNDVAALGAGAYRTGTASVSLGTAGIILAPVDAPVRAVSPQLDIFPHASPDKWYAMGMLKAAGFAVKWLKERLADEALGESAPSTSDWMRGLGLDSGSVEPGSGGLFCFPYYQGRGNPEKDPQALGVLFGLSSAHTNRHLVQATMEGVSYCARQCIERIEDAVAVRDVVCCGGGSSNELWLEILAGVLRKPVWKSAAGDEGALGSAILGAVGIGMYPTVEAAGAVLTRLGRRVEPSPEAVGQYEELFQRFCALSRSFWGK